MRTAAQKGHQVAILQRYAEGKSVNNKWVQENLGSQNSTARISAVNKALENVGIYVQKLKVVHETEGFHYEYSLSRADQVELLRLQDQGISVLDIFGIRRPKYFLFAIDQNQDHRNMGILAPKVVEKLPIQPTLFSA